MLAVIRLEEGVEVMSSIVGEDRLAVEIGSPVALAAKGWSTKAQFELVRAGSD